IRYRATVRAHVGALVREKLVFQTENEAVVVDRGAHPVHLIPRVVRSEKMLSPVFDPLDRPAQAQRARTYQHILRVKFAADAKPAPDVAFAEFDSPLR